MKRALSLVSIAAISMSIALFAQSPAYPGMSPGSERPDQQPRVPRTTPDEGATPRAGQQESAQAQPMQAAALTAELTKKVDSKSAKTGDEVSAKTTSPVKLQDGTELPRGTKLVGKVTSVQASSKGAKTSQLAFSLDHAILKDGHDLALRTAVASVAAPASTSNSTVTRGPAPSTTAPSGDMGGGSASASPAPTAPVVTDNSGSEPQSQAGILRSTDDRVAVGNLPGVMLNGNNAPDSSATLEASGKNISLDSGTKLILLVAMPQRAGL
jgi:hypothetical protein